MVFFLKDSSEKGDEKEEEEINSKKYLSIVNLVVLYVVQGYISCPRIRIQLREVNLQSWTKPVESIFFFF